MILKWGILNAESCPWSMDSLTFTLRVFHQSGKFKSLIGRSGEINMPPPSGQFHSLSPRWTFLVLVRKNTVAMNPVYWTSCWTTSCADMSQSGLLIMIHKSAWCLSISHSHQQHENYQNYTFTLKGLRSGIERCIHNESPVSFLSHPSLKQLDHHAHLTQISRLHPFQQIAQCSQLSVQTSLLGPGSPHSKHISWDSGVSKKMQISDFNGGSVSMFVRRLSPASLHEIQPRKFLTVTIPPARVTLERKDLSAQKAAKSQRTTIGHERWYYCQK